MNKTKYYYLEIRDLLTTKLIKTGSLLFFSYFLLMALLYSKTFFFCDESDNFLGGMVVANGGDVYKDFVSQHMPVMYYVSAIFRVLGAHSVLGYRFFWYAFLAFIWVLMYFRYNDKFGKKVMSLYPIAYIVVMSYYIPCSNAITSDHLQAIGMVVLFLEFMMFLKTCKIELKSCFWISFGIFISFGTAFVSAFAIFVIFISVLIIEVTDSFKNKLTFSKNLRRILAKYWKLVVIVLLPFIVLIFWYAVTGNLYNFYFGAYKLNTTIYSKYKGGYGTDFLDGFISPILGFARYLKSGIGLLRSNVISGMQILIFCVTNILFFIKIFKKHKIGSAAIALFTFMCAARGYNDFHSMPYYAVTVLMGVILFSDLFKNSLRNIRIVVVTFTVIVATILSIPVFMHMRSVIEPTCKPSGEYINAIRKLTDENDKIYIDTLDFYIFIESNRRPIYSGVSSTPWTYEAYGEKELKALKEYRPKVAIHNSEYELWGHVRDEYAPEVNRYIQDNYIPVDEERLPFLYVRDDLYEEACRSLNLKKADINMGKSKSIVGPILDGQEVSQTFVSSVSRCEKVSVKIGTYMRKNSSKLRVKLIDYENNDVIFEDLFDTENFLDNQYNELLVPCDLNVGKQYKISFKAEKSDKNNYITIYNTAQGTAEDNNFADFDGKKQVYNLCIMIYSK